MVIYEKPKTIDNIGVEITRSHFQEDMSGGRGLAHERVELEERRLPRCIVDTHLIS